jgi:hypothetical protein
MDGAAECVRCFRSEADHDLERSGHADEVQRRIWKALGWPCGDFTLEAASIFARNQAATSRWARRPAPSPALAPTASAPAHVAARGAAAARAALQHREAS